MSSKSEAGIARLLILVDTLAVNMAQGLANIDGRFGALEGRMRANELAISRLRNDIDKRFDRMDERFDAIDIRFERLERPKRKRDR